MSDAPGIKDAYRLFHRGALALAQMEECGIRVDVDYLESATRQAAAEIAHLESLMYADDIYRVWRNRFGERTNLTSKPQLAEVMFGELGYENRGYTEGSVGTDNERLKADESSFSHIDAPFVAHYFKAEKLRKLTGTYFAGLRRELVDGFIHPFFNLHTARTYRSSSSDINFQNIPIRDPDIGHRIRKCFVPRPGRRFIEADFGALEFRIAACFWKDKGMIDYASDPNKDVHRDQAALLFKCPHKEVSKPMRQAGKNQFVFPVLYGSYYASCAPHLWESATKGGLKTASGVPVVDWLKSQGVERLGECDPKKRPVPGTFEHHVKSVEDKFYANFPTFAERKEKWWREYQKTGQFSMMTGFVCKGVYSKNFLMNSAVQGPAFHCLLWCDVVLQEWINRNRLESMIVAEIHDCVMFDTAECELQTVLREIRRVMTDDLRKEFSWVVTPMEVEIDVTPIDGDWTTKAPWSEENGLWQPRKKSA